MPPTARARHAQRPREDLHPAEQGSQGVPDQQHVLRAQGPRAILGEPGPLQLIKISFTHGLLRDLARYLIKRQDLELWAKVLTKDESAEDGGADVEKESQGRRLIDQVVEWALPESESADEVSCTFKALYDRATGTIASEYDLTKRAHR